MQPVSYMTSLLTFYLKGRFEFDNNTVKYSCPNTFLTLIPLGSKKQSIPVNQISSVSTSFKVLAKPLFAGIIEALIGFACFGDSFVLGLILLLLGVATIINALQTNMKIELTSSKSYYASFLIFEKGKAELVAETINNLINSRMNDTNNRVVAENQTNAIVDAINNAANNK